MLIHILFAIVVALVFTAILAAIFGREGYEEGGWATALILFGVLFLTSWAGGVWLTPIGPQLLGVPWLPFVLMGFVAALLLAAMSPGRPPRTRREAREQAEAQEVVSTTASAFVWILAVCMIFAITLHYAYQQQQVAGRGLGPEDRAAQAPAATERH
ncbi:MAG TPA: hypothetical protein VJ783_29665 [Pirellulales bacterium]|nr:hypothetical protein [Pirellulales bacterium]